MYDSTARKILMISFFMLSVKLTVFQIMKNVEMETPKNNMLTSSWLHLDIFPVIRVAIIFTTKVRSKSNGMETNILITVVRTSCSGKKPLEFSGLDLNSE